MRRLFLLLSIAAALSCTKTGDSPVNVSAALPSPSKVAVGPASEGYYPLYWQEGDAISVNGTLSQALGAASDGRAEVNFVLNSFAGNSPYDILYPGSSANRVNLDGTILPLYARTASLEEMVFLRHLGAGLSIGLSGDLDVASLTLTAPGGEPVGGSFDVDFSSGTLSADAALSAVTVPGPAPLAEGDVRHYRLYFAPGTFSLGLVLRAQSPGGSVMEWQFARGAALEKGRMYVLPDTRFASRDFSDGVPVLLENLTENLVSFEL